MWPALQGPATEQEELTVAAVVTSPAPVEDVLAVVAAAPAVIHARIHGLHFLCQVQLGALQRGAAGGPQATRHGRRHHQAHRQAAVHARSALLLRHVRRALNRTLRRHRAAMLVACADTTQTDRLGDTAPRRPPRQAPTSARWCLIPSCLAVTRAGRPQANTALGSVGRAPLGSQLPLHTEAARLPATEQAWPPADGPPRFSGSSGWCKGTHAVR